MTDQPAPEVEATPEERAAARTRIRAKLAEMDARWTPQRRAEYRRRVFGPDRTSSGA